MIRAFLKFALALLLLLQLPLALLPAANDNLKFSVREPTELIPDPQRRGMPKYVWVAYEGYHPRVSWDPKSDKYKEDPKLTFMESYAVADEVQDKGGSYLLARTDPDGKKLMDKKDGDPFLGWVPAKYLIVQPKANIDNATGIVRKALIVNKLEHLGEPYLKILRIPMATSEEGKDESHRLYSTLFVYGEADGYVLVGDVPSFPAETPSKQLARRIQGWLPASRVAIWNTREAVEWDHESTLEPDNRTVRVIGKRASDKPRRTTLGKIYASKEDARKALKNDSVKALEAAGIEVQLEEAAFQRDPRRKDLKYEFAPPLPPDAPRFPVLGHARDEDTKAGELLEVGAIGGLVDKDGKVILSGGEIHRFRQMLAKLTAEQTQTDMVILIDNTDSMETARDTTAQVVRAITKASRESKTSLRISVSFFNDDVDTSRDLGIPVTQINKLEDVAFSGDKIADAVAKTKVGGGKDKHEMVFRGIVEACDPVKVGWRAGARKILVVIGDCGDICANKERIKTLPKYAESYNVKSIVERLVPDNLDLDDPIEFYSFQVEKAEENTPTGDFDTQMREIASEHHKRLLAKRKEQLGKDFDEKAVARLALPPFDVSEDNKGIALAKALQNRYKQLAEDADKLREQMGRLRDGKWLTTRLPAWQERRIELEAKEKKLNVTLESLRRSQGFQMFMTGYVWKKNNEGLPLLRERVLVNGGELKQLCDVLIKLDPEGFEDTPALDLIHATIKARVGDFKNKVAEELSLKDVTKLGSGTRFKKALLSKKLAELDKSGSAVFYQQERYDLLFSMRLLEDARDGLSYRYKATSQSDKSGRKWTDYQRDLNSKQQVPRAFNPANSLSGPPVSEEDKKGLRGLEWYYIDYQEEWP